MYANQHQTKRSFEVGDLAFLRLQPYKQSTLKKSGAEKFKLRFYGLYKILWKVGKVTYELELPSDSKIHNVYHVSCLKKVVGQQVITSVELPPLDEEGQLELIPETVMAVRKKKLRGKIILEYLIR